MNNLVKLNIAICFLMCLLLGGKGIYYSQHCNSQWFADSKYGSMFQSNVGFTEISECDPLNSKKIQFIPTGITNTSRLNELILRLYESRKQAYLDTRSNLKTILVWLFFGVILSARIIFTQPNELDIPLVNFKIPVALFYFFMPIAFIFLWNEFGLILTATIDSRMVLEEITDYLEVIDGQAVAYYFSNARTFVDQGFVDHWCTFYYHVFGEGINPEIHEKVSFTGLFLVFGSFLGLMHAVCLILTLYNQNNKLRLFLNLAILGTFVFHTYLLIKWYEHAAFLSSWIWCMAGISMAIWSWLEKRDQVTVESTTTGS